MSKNDNLLSVNKSKAILATKISNLLDYGRTEVTTRKQLEKYPIGSLISYMNTKNIFKIGGFIVKFANEYFIYIKPDFTKKYRVRYKNVQKMWVGNVYKVRGDIVSLAKTNQKPTNFEVIIGDIIIYYARRTFDKKRFMNTEKYKTMLLWYNYFENSDSNK